MSPDEKTVPVEPPLGEVVSPHLEFWLRSPQGALRTYPVRSRTRVGPAGSPDADIEVEASPRVLLTLAEGRIFYQSQSPQPSLYCNGQATVSGPLLPGSVLQLGDHQLQLWDRSQGGAYLEGYSEPYSGRFWLLSAAQHTVGRPGRRDNSIGLEHPTVSREHATLKLAGEEAQVVAESATNLVGVNGQRLDPGQVQTLQNGDLLELGALLFRFHRQAPLPTGAGSLPARLCLKSFGTMQVSVGSTTFPDKAWRTQNVRWLLARLGHSWGRSVPAEALVDLFWPDISPEKGRNNLNYTLSNLRQLLAREQTDPKPEFIERTSQWLRLNPETLGDHDYTKMQQHLVAAAQIRTTQGVEAARQELEKAFSLYQGPYLEGCYQDWACQARELAEMEALAAGRSLLTLYSEGQEWNSVLEVAPQILRWDNCCQVSYLALMQANIARGGAEEALRLYEACCKSLRRELGVEPSLALVREFQRAQMML